MVTTLNNLKAAFTNQDKPDQSDFANLIDTLGQYLNVGGNSQVVQSLGQWVYQTNHGFSSGQVVSCVGSVESGGITTPVYNLALATDAAQCQVSGVVLAIQDANNFFLATNGLIQLSQSMLGNFLDNVNFSSPYTLTAGVVYYLSEVTPGSVESSQPVTPDNWIVSVGIAQTTGDTSSNASAVATVLLRIGVLGQVEAPGSNNGTGSAAGSSGVDGVSAILNIPFSSTVNSVDVNVAVDGFGGYNTTTPSFYVGGSFSIGGGVTQNRISKFNYSLASGPLASYSLDSTWNQGAGFNDTVCRVRASAASNDIVVGGYFTYYTPKGLAAVFSSGLIRLSAGSGAPVNISGFNLNAGGSSHGVFALEEISIGSTPYTVVGGAFTTAGIPAYGLALFPNTSATPTWGLTGITSNSGFSIRSIHQIGTNGELLITGAFTKINIGSGLDTTNCIVIGHFSSATVFVIDYTYAGSINGIVYDAICDVGDGSGGAGGLNTSNSNSNTSGPAIIIAGSFTSIKDGSTTYSRPGLARLYLPSSPGAMTLDIVTKFPISGTFYSVKRMLDSANVGNLLVGGTCSTGNLQALTPYSVYAPGTSNYNLGAYTVASGSNMFNASTNNTVQRLLVDTSNSAATTYGYIMASGDFTTANGVARGHLAQFTTSGALL
jgi:hypothetical protein